MVDSEVRDLSRSYGEKCGVLGLYGVENASSKVATGINLLQHRGLYRAGIASSNEQEIYFYGGRGLVSQVFNRFKFNRLPGEIAIGHTQYPTSVRSTNDHRQPVLAYEDSGIELAMGHNGNLASTRALQRDLEFRKVPHDDLNDSEMMHASVAHRMRQGASLEDAIKDSWPLFTGVFSALFMTKDKIAAIRDKNGIRPLSWGEVDGGFGFSSEDYALSPFLTHSVQDVQPGEMVVASKNGIEKEQIEPGDLKLDIFEFIYFSWPMTTLLGKKVGDVRRNFGRELARELLAKGNLDIDLVCPIPNSGKDAAWGCAQELGIPYAEGLMRNPNALRTFIEQAHLRQSKAEEKYTGVLDIVKGKNILSVDDSVFRGTTQPITTRKFMEAEARSVRAASASPPVIYPNFYGVDTPGQSGLVAAVKTMREMIEMFGVVDLDFLSIDGMVRATGLPRRMLSMSDFDGVYHSDIYERKNEVSYSFAA